MSRPRHLTRHWILHHAVARTWIRLRSTDSGDILWIARLGDGGSTARLAAPKLPDSSLSLRTRILARSREAAKRAGTENPAAGGPLGAERPIHAEVFVPPRAGVALLRVRILSRGFSRGEPYHGRPVCSRNGGILQLVKIFVLHPHRERQNYRIAFSAPPEDRDLSSPS